MNLWEISQPVRETVIGDLQRNSTISVRLSYTITRNPPSQDDSEDITAVVSGENQVNIAADDLRTRNALINILSSTSDLQTEP